MGRLFDGGGVQAVGVDQVPGRGRAGKAVLHADTPDGDGVFLGQQGADRLAQAADDAVLFAGDDLPAVAGQKFLPPGIPLGTKLSAEPCTRRKAARTLSALNFPVCVPSIRTCRLDGTFLQSGGAFCRITGPDQW